MNLAFHSVSIQSKLFAVLLVVVVISSLFELVSEIAAGERWFEMFDDIVLFILGIVVSVLFCLDYLKQMRSLRALKQQLESVRGKLDDDDQTIGNQYRAVVRKQFETWQLTPAEQEIAMCLIKGLSFREVAELRNTKEKTARQHAANVYKKAGLSGRHELAGWFFEDVFNPNPDTMPH